MTSWPSGLRRVTRNHFSVGGAGSNPADVVSLFFTFVFLEILRCCRPKFRCNKDDFLVCTQQRCCRC